MAERGFVVSNSSPLIGLARIGQLDLMRALLAEVIVPPAVLHEVFADRDPPAWLRVVAPAVAFDDAASPTLGLGEREAIALAVETRARRIILDDLPARRLAASLGLPVIGTAGLVLAAKNAGLVPAITPLLDQLVAAGFRFSPTVIAAVLQRARRSDAGGDVHGAEHERPERPQAPCHYRRAPTGSRNMRGGGRQHVRAAPWIMSRLPEQTPYGLPPTRYGSSASGHCFRRRFDGAAPVEMCRGAERLARFSWR
jgi:predicted nucleic acid-binding protein